MMFAMTFNVGIVMSITEVVLPKKHNIGFAMSLIEKKEKKKKQKKKE